MSNLIEKITVEPDPKSLAPMTAAEAERFLRWVRNAMPDRVTEGMDERRNRELRESLFADYEFPDAPKAPKPDIMVVIRDVARDT